MIEGDWAEEAVAGGVQARRQGAEVVRGGDRAAAARR